MLKFSFIAFLAVTASSFTEASEELTAFAKVSKDCFDENQVTQEEFKNFYMNGMKPETATQHIQCHIKCIMERLNHMKSGILDVNAAVKTWAEIPEFKSNLDTVRKGYEICKSEKGKNDCETAYKITMCLQKHDVGGDLEV